MLMYNSMRFPKINLIFSMRWNGVLKIKLAAKWNSKGIEQNL